MDKEIKNKKIEIRVTSDEKKSIERAAKDHHFGSVSEFIRVTILSKINK